MTQAPQQPREPATGISLLQFFALAAVLVTGAFAAIWFAVPGPDTRHTVTAPSGSKHIELAEQCNDQGCVRVAVLDVTQPDGDHLRTYCPFERAETGPVLQDIVASWSDAEDSVVIAFTTDQGMADTLTITLADCTITGQ